MKILCINIPNIDLSYFTIKGFPFEVTHKTITEKFPLKYLYDVKDQNGQIVSLYTPDVNTYLEANYKQYEYPIILVGYDSNEYGPELKSTGGYTFHSPLSSGTFWATVRNGQNSFAVHELHHCLCNIINIKFGDHVPKDFMDQTFVNGNWLPYYKDNDPNAPDGNHTMTWKNIIPWIPKLQAITSNIVTLRRGYADKNQQLGDLIIGNFACKTLELPWKDNQQGISAIPKGLYDVRYTFSPKFMKYTYEVLNVPNRAGIRIHSGNYFFNINGCILLGDRYGDLNGDSSADILNSKITLANFEKKMGYKPFKLEIK